MNFGTKQAHKQSFNRFKVQAISNIPYFHDLGKTSKYDSFPSIYFNNNIVRVSAQKYENIYSRN